ncbi:MAG TPA: ABC transporter permease [Candidatus Limnocylindria bacterium]|nr:ABC transporter permease [Candidatus Limnocylindria bacterium]
MRDLWRSLVRVTSFLGKELRETIRRPGILAALVIGPFLIMLIFGLGYNGTRRPFTTEVVVPENSELPDDAGFYENLAPGRIDVVSVTTDPDAAANRLRDRQTDLMVQVPPGATQQLEKGKQAQILVAWNQVDPVYDQLANLAVASMVSALNAEIIKRVAGQGIDLSGTNVSPDLIAHPTTAVTKNIAPSTVSVLNFFSPAVLALVIQHLAITLSALSMVRERLSGQMDLFRVAPVNAIEVLTGKYLAYAILSLLATAAVGAAMIYGLHVPVISGYLLPVAVILLLTFAGLGVGLLISLVADSERMAVQLAMLVLLASVFFSGFVLPVKDFVGPVQVLSYFLPVTHAIALLQDGMLRGQLFQAWMLPALAGIGLALYLISLVRMQSVLKGAGRPARKRRLVPLFGGGASPSE